MQDSFLLELPGHQPRLWRFALRLTRNQHDAEDLLQRSYVRAIEKRSQWQPATSMLSWVFAIMHSIWANDLRHPSLRAVAPEDAQELVEELPDTSVAHNPEQAVMFGQIVNTVQSLPEAQRLVLLMIAVEGLTYQETADVLSIPIGTVMSRFARARMSVGERFNQASAPRNTTFLEQAVL